MKLFLISQNINSDYDTYDSAVVVAADEESARHIYPGSGGWAAPENVSVEYLGMAKRGSKPGVICASFNAG